MKIKNAMLSLFWHAHTYSRGTERREMETNVPPRMYTEPPAFDIQVDDFATLPLRRLEAFRLLRSGLQGADGTTTTATIYGSALAEGTYLAFFLYNWSIIRIERCAVERY